MLPGKRAPKVTLVFLIAISLFVVSVHLVCGADTIENSPQRIVSLGPINTENVYLLGAGDKLVGTTTYCVRPEAARNTEKIGSVMQISVERIIGLQPDIVLATGLTNEQQIQLLQNAGLQVVRFDQPTSFASSCEQFELLANLLGLDTKGKQITNFLRKQVQEIATQVAEQNLPKQSVVLQIGAHPLYVAGNDSFTNDFIRLIHAENVVGDKASGRVGYERIIAEDPDVILIGIMGSETGVAADERKKWNSISVLTAVKNKRIHVVDPDLVCSPSPATFVEALKFIVPLIYPVISLTMGKPAEIASALSENQPRVNNRP